MEICVLGEKCRCGKCQDVEGENSTGFSTRFSMYADFQMPVQGLTGCEPSENTSFHVSRGDIERIDSRGVVAVGCQNRIQSWPSHSHHGVILPQHSSRRDGWTTDATQYPIRSTRSISSVGGVMRLERRMRKRPKSSGNILIDGSGTSRNTLSTGLQDLESLKWRGRWV